VKRLEDDEGLGKLTKGSLTNYTVTEEEGGGGARRGVGTETPHLKEQNTKEVVKKQEEGG